ncbi:MAG TPA: Fur family transcriptional regulator [Pyrinomonadaceae bacterium]|nr:Fur family transcriptional regulator [Pyrinomonadaceae bacterium]
MASKKDEFKKEKEIFLEHIRNSGLRKTAQRDLIMETFLRNEEHLTSEDLYWLVHKQDPTVGHTTVYRTLKLLIEAGLAREVRFGDNRTYYEHHYDHEHHDHMICTECGRVIEFFSPEIESMQDNMADKLGFYPTHHSLRIWGLCSECQKEASSVHSAPPGAQPKVKMRTVAGN